MESVHNYSREERGERGNTQGVPLQYNSVNYGRPGTMFGAKAPVGPTANC